MPRKIRTYRPPGARTVVQARRDYDAHRRDRASKGFYNSAAWRKARLLKLAESPLCELCRRSGRLTAATTVHHRQELRDRPDLALDLANLQSVCPPCHSRHHAARAPG